MPGPSIEILISVSTFLAKSRHLSEHRILFIVENDLSTPAVPIGSKRIVFASLLKVGKRATFSGSQHIVSKLVGVDRSHCSLLRIRHSNIRGLRANKEELSLLLSDFNPSIVSLHETFVNVNKTIIFKN